MDTAYFYPREGRNMIVGTIHTDRLKQEIMTI